MKIIANGNGYTYTVDHMEFEKDGTVKYIRGFMDWHGFKNYAIGASAEYINLDKDVILTIEVDK